MTTDTAPTQLLGADPVSHETLRARLDNPADRPTAGPSWQDRMLAGVQMRDVETETAGGYTRLRGLAVPYDTWASIGWFLEAFEPGSLGKSIDEAAAAGRDLPLNLFHDNRSFPIGAAEEWDETKAGLVGTWRLDTSERAQEAARLADQKLLTGLSIEFSPVRSAWKFADEWNPELGPDYMDQVVRVEARLGAVGLVQTPAYVAANLDLVRSADARRRGEVVAAAKAAPALAEWKAELSRLQAGA